MSIEDFTPDADYRTPSGLVLKKLARNPHANVDIVHPDLSAKLDELIGAVNAKKDIEQVLMCDNGTTFIRNYTYADGALSGATDTLPDGVTSYAASGAETVGACAAAEIQPYLANLSGTLFVVNGATHGQGISNLQFEYFEIVAGELVTIPEGFNAAIDPVTFDVTFTANVDMAGVIAQISAA